MRMVLVRRLGRAVPRAPQCLRSMISSPCSLRYSSSFVDVHQHGHRAPSPGLTYPEAYVSKHARLAPGTVEAFLTQAGLQFQLRDGRANVKKCPFCHPDKAKADNLWKLYIWVDNGRCFCHRCLTNCSFVELKWRLSGSQQKIVSINDIFRPERPPPAPLNQTRVAEMRDTLFKEADVLEFLTKTRGIQERVLREYGVGAAELSFVADDQGNYVKEKCIVFPWARKEEDTGTGSIYVDRIKFRSIVRKGNQRLEPSAGPWGMFGWHTIPASAEEVIITEGELDAMSVFQETGKPTLSLPNGARSFPPAIIPCLERFKSITLWLDDDTAGRAGVDKISKKLGLRRCKVVRSRAGRTDGPKDANEALLKGMDLSSILATAELPSHKMIIKAEHLRDEVFDQVVNRTIYQGTPFVSLPGLQGLLKGHRKGELTIFTGATGLGKTTVLSQISVDLALQGVNTLWGSFEVKNHLLVKTMISQYDGTALEDWSRDQFDLVYDRFQTVPLYFLKFFSGSSIDNVIEAMEFAVYVHDVEHILLDNLQFMLGSVSATRSYNKFDEQDQAIARLREFATKHNVHITLVVHPRKEPIGQRIQVSSVFGSAKATQEADNVIILEASEACNEIRQLVIGKNRYDGEVGSIPYRYDRPSRRIVELDSFEKKQLQRMMVSLRANLDVGKFAPSVAKLSSMHSPAAGPSSGELQRTDAAPAPTEFIFK